ncbi:branched-chain amino acid ABC transporter permease [Stappia indica]|uniref:Amino acid/amide ABC transporter membrane protein 2, HAAT family n=1 Tax=Stappia indica TaxID=538381 RepID=A0A285T304_9HYPH|nr:branched-chain amino acid ABC transporter permease [Stappia indica]MCC4246075.1 branched-chain amino acid ABC transporter permease [Stappia indica]SOC15646.1 amino acid/amide ABC transporter membrane protein 2, HAAT family [Stappia indica]
MSLMSRSHWILTALVLAILVSMPLLLPDFWLSGILGRSLIYGIVALSITFLASYGGFISLAQTMLAGIAGYTVAILAPTAIPASASAVSYWLAMPLAVLAATVAGAVVGLIAIRTRDIYLLMITLALAVGFSLFAQSNIDWFNGYEGIRNVVGPDLFGLPFRTHAVFYYVSLTLAALLYVLVLYVVRTPFGLVLQGIRDNPRRVAALGYNVAVHRIAAFAMAGFIAGCGGVLITFYNIGITPGSIGMTATVNVLVMSVIGGLGHPVGAFIGAVIFTLIDTFAATIYDRDRFNTLIGLVFLGIVVASPDGVLGLGKRLTGWGKRKDTEDGGTPH